ncbi:hypothetical protein E3P99_02210 [Wallemia hederae]|uniref:Uncharacterized protein n=1 Tax=Wallemia hederae TaxID=1540922 RepID=A0A4T0FLI5_9BASI|nr:hypothetical protein E3P99_02210 [Wallemia hederae]
MDVDELIGSLKESHVGEHELDIQAIRKQLIQTICPSGSTTNSTHNNATPLSTPKLKSSQLAAAGGGGNAATAAVSGSSEQAGVSAVDNGGNGGSSGGLLFTGNSQPVQPVSTSTFGL